MFISQLAKRTKCEDWVRQERDPRSLVCLARISVTAEPNFA